jgi:hypothetical protein
MSDEKPSDIADVAAEWLDALSGVVHQWFQYQDDTAQKDNLITAIDHLIRVHPAYKGAVDAERAGEALKAKRDLKKKPPTR